MLILEILRKIQHLDERAFRIWHTVLEVTNPVFDEQMRQMEAGRKAWEDGDSSARIRSSCRPASGNVYPDGSRLQPTPDLPQTKPTMQHPDTNVYNRSHTTGGNRGA